MNRITVDLQNCYGIKKLRKEFDFSSEPVYAIYAPNGQMKSSFARTFQDIADDADSKDRIFSTRVSKRRITDENGADLAPDSVLVVQPYDQEFSHTEKTSTLLVDAKLRKEYEALYAGIEKAKAFLLAALKVQSGSKKDLEREISLAFTSSDDDFFLALTRIKQELIDQKDAPLADIPYDKIFDDKVLAALNSKDVKNAIADYITRYNELLAASTYFRKGTFDYYNASQIAKSLASNGFFDMKHTVKLNASTIKEITTQKELEDVIEEEKKAIITDKALRAQFNKVADKLDKNITVRDFQSYLLDHEAVLSQLDNIDKFKESIWKSYLKSQFDLYSELMNKYESAQQRKKEIEEEAAKQRTQWEEVIQIFNDRFFVPFTLAAHNRTAVMLGYEDLIHLDFTYHDGAEEAAIDKEDLLNALSTGEKKALYILNIIFEVSTRSKNKQETIIIVDDIADSFDYQNKYAIIQYLKDISHDGLFKQIIMTHNFDFFRTINQRMVSYPHCLMSIKDGSSVKLEQATGVRNVFLNDWKGNFFNDKRKMVASIPFIRNLIEYARSDQDKDYLKLTSLLHWKNDSASVTEADLGQIYVGFFGGQNSFSKSTAPILDVISSEANSCMTATTGINFENKIVLSIAIRLAAEKFMANRIADPAFMATIQHRQTTALLDKFKTMFRGDKAIEVLDCVILMTPENIHLNSFMYEPIVDMNDDQLRKLYTKVTALR